MHHLVHLAHLTQLATLRVLVTGAAGFIGARLCRALRRYGADVHGVSRQLMQGGELTWWQADLADANAVNQIMKETKPDIVYHLASHVSGRRHVDTVLPT